MPVALHDAPDHGAVEDIERSKQRRGSDALVVVGHGGTAAALQRKAGLGAVKRLDLALLVNGQHDAWAGGET